MALCNLCGGDNAEGTAFCLTCGVSLTGVPVAQEMKKYTSYNQQKQYQTKQNSRMTAGLLQIFLGGFGVGRFYLDYTLIGTIQLLVTIFTCGIGGIWGFIDGIMILLGIPDVDGRNVPLK